MAESVRESGGWVWRSSLVSSHALIGDIGVTVRRDVITQVGKKEIKIGGHRFCEVLLGDRLFANGRLRVIGPRAEISLPHLKNGKKKNGRNPMPRPCGGIGF